MRVRARVRARARARVRVSLERAAALVEAEARPVGGDELLVLDAPVAVGVRRRDEAVHLLLGHPVEAWVRVRVRVRLRLRIRVRG